MSTEMTVVSRADAVNLAESNMRVFDKARIHKPRRCQRTMSCRTRISCQLGRASKSRIESVDMRYAVQPKGRKADGLQAVG